MGSGSAEGGISKGESKKIEIVEGGRWKVAALEVGLHKMAIRMPHVEEGVNGPGIRGTQVKSSVRMKKMQDSSK